MFTMSKCLTVPLVLALLSLGYVCRAQRLGINVVDSAEYSRPTVVRLNMSGARGSRGLLLLEIPRGEKQHLKFTIASTHKRASMQPVINDGKLSVRSPWEIDGALAPGEGTGFYIQAVAVAEPGEPADILVLRSELGSKRIEVWITPVEGQWRAAGQDGGELNTRVVGVHAALVRQGERTRVLFFAPPGRHPNGHWNAAELDNMDAAMWDMQTNRVSVTTFTRNLFCSGHALLPDGRLLIAGGHIGGPFTNNARGAFIFDGFLPNSAGVISPGNFLEQPVWMQNARWYPTVTALPDGKMLISSGRGVPLTNTVADAGWYRTIARDYEVFQISNPAFPVGGLVGRFHGNGLEDRDVDFGTYPAVMVLPQGNGYPDGAVFMQEQRLGRLYAYRPAAERVLEQAANGGRSFTWTMHHQGSRSYPYYGAAVLLPFATNNSRRVRVLVSGGQARRYIVNPLDLDSNQPATASTEIFDFDSALPLNQQRGWRVAAPMHNARFLHDATLLANGEVLISGGARQGWTNVNQGPVFDAELFDPESESFRPAARQRIERRYHSVALLLPDGTVLKAGSTGGYTNETLVPQLIAERYFPPYMWRGPRPIIASISGASPNVNGVSYGQSFDVVVQGVDLSGMRAALVRTTSVTHGNNMDQRFVWLEAQQLGSNGTEVRLRLQAPRHGSIAPPGDYMLFVVDGFGVPSAAKFIRLA